MSADLARSVLQRHWNGLLPIDPRILAQAEGAVVRGERYLNETAGGPLSGVFGFDGGIPTILYNEAEHPNRQRFTIAHELGHMMCSHLHGEGQDVLFRDPAANFFGSYDPKETEANQFAAELLMPEEVVRHMIRTTRGRTVEDLAQMFGVSTRAMSYRLINLGVA